MTRRPRRLGAGCKGFTLLELVVATSLAVVIGVAAVLVLGRGLTAWQRADGRLQIFFVVERGLNRMAEELRNAVVLADSPFVGEAGQMVFLKSEGATGLRQVRYALQGVGEDSVLIREGLAFPETEEEEVVTQRLVGRVSRFSMTYAYQGEAPGELLYLDTWQPDDALPKFLRVRLAAEDAEGRAHDVTRDFWLPHGVLIPPEEA